jgi:hypothetical protein
MKQTLLLVLLLANSYIGKAQIFQLGLRFGAQSANINAKEASNSNLQTIAESDARFGFHAGLYSRIMVLGFYVQPEVLFVSNSSDMVIPGVSTNTVAQLNYNRLDVPVLVGKRFFGIVRANAGPVFTQYLSADVRNGGITEDIINQYKSSTVGYQIGVGADIWKLRLDLKYEGGFGAVVNNLSIQGQSFNTDLRPRQWVMSVGWRLL